MKSKSNMSKFIRSLGVLALFLGAQTMSFDAEAQTPDINSLEYFPVVPGTTWKYLVDGKKTMTVSVLNKTVEIGGVETTVFYYLPGGAKEFYTSDSNGIRLHRIFQPNVYIEGVGYINFSLTFIPPVVYADEWVQIGQTFESSGIVRTNNLPLVGVVEFLYDASFTFEGFDNVTVPAGSFFDVGVLSGTLTIEGEPESQGLYLAEGFGAIKMTDTFEGNTQNAELLSTNAGYVTLLTPNGGEVIPAGSTYDISWEASVDALYFNLKYSMDNGLTWLSIPGAENVTENHYLWTVPTPAGNKRSCRVKVTGYNAADINVETDTSDAPFTIEVAKIVQPNGGETLSSGSSYPIQWEINGTKSAVTKVNLYYTTDKGVSYVLISTLAGSDRSYNWTVPTPLSNKKNTCYVKVVAYSGTAVVGSDTSDKPFTIEVAKIVQPNGGETLSSGGSYPVQWEINGTKSAVTKVNLYYTTNKGVSYGLITSIQTVDPGTRPWAMSHPWAPTVTSEKPYCKVKIVLYNAKNIILSSDVSDSYFTISP